MDERERYWLGFLVADGYVDPQGFAHANLSVRDADHLRMMAADLRPGTEVRVYGPAARIRLDRRWAGFLRESREHPEPDAPFMRGLTDGDGCWYVRRVRHSRNGAEMTRASYTLIGERGLMEVARSWLAAECGLGLATFRDRGRVVEMRYEGVRQVARIADVLYRDATVWLPRKRATAEAARPAPPRLHAPDGTFLPLH